MLPTSGLVVANSCQQLNVCVYISSR